MAKTPRDKLEHERNKIRTAAETGNITEEACDRLLEFGDAVDEKIMRVKYFDGDGNAKTLAPRSIQRYLNCLRLAAERGVDLLECSADEFNAAMDGFHDDRGLSKTTIVGYQCAAQAFFRYHDDLGVDPDDILVYNERSNPRHDERDMFDESEVDALRDACTNPRDRAFLELLIYTGQRITALRTLRRKDVDVDEGFLYLNDEFDDEHGGLKGATRRGRKRPLLGARKYVRDWKHQYHPHDDPDAPLFVGSPSSGRTKIDQPWSEPGVRGQLRRIAERAGVEKPVNPHNFRHYWVTVMKREYSMDSDTMRAMLGVTKDSSVLDRVYSHVTNDDYVRKAEEATGYREPEGPGTFTPDVCPTCGEKLKPHWRRCPACDELFAPDLEDLAEETSEAADAVLETGLSGDQPLTAEERRAFREHLAVLDDVTEIADRAEDAG